MWRLPWSGSCPATGGATTLSLSEDAEETDLKHGLSWDTLRAVLSFPQLRDFNLKFQWFCPALRPGEELSVASLAPLETFSYKMEYPRDIWFFLSEVAALEAVLGKLCDT